MAKEKPVIAIMYDFDKTLCTKDMQEYGFIPKLGMPPKEFWTEANRLAQSMDRILAYMYLMKRKAEAHDVSIRREDFVELGRGVEFFAGVDGWFDRIDSYAKGLDIVVEHYIISSGLKEIIEGSSISTRFKRIYACEFHYNASGAVDWPALAVNYTGKTQFLFRINKGVLDISDDLGLNKFVEDDKRPIPFRNMIYIGDGFTDVPCMKLVKVNGGQSIAVYPSRGSKTQVEELLLDKRVDFIAQADYRESKQLDRIVKLILTQMAATNKLFNIHRKQRATRPRVKLKPKLH